MAARISENRQMFWRITRRMLGAHRGRLFVVLLALGAGAAVTAALLNLQIDARQRLSSEFRAFGPNVLVLPKNASASSAETLPETIAKLAPTEASGGHVQKISQLYFVASVSTALSAEPISAVVAGTNPLAFVRGTAMQAGVPVSLPPVTGRECVLGMNLARKLSPGKNVYLDLNEAEITLTSGGAKEICEVASFGQRGAQGGPEDDRIEIGLRAGQRLANLPGRISVLELIVPGTPKDIQGYVANLQHLLPGAEVRPVRQFTEGEAKIYGRISGLLTATVVVVLALTSLCVMAAMTNVAMERKNDVGLMKAIGGATRRVLRLFLVEAAVLGLTGGILGAAAGILLSIWLGKEVFGVAAQPRLIVYPVAVVLTVIVAILSAFPLRRLASVRPASVFRGEV
jgi:putative ABC transport system permease protein